MKKLLITILLAYTAGSAACPMAFRNQSSAPIYIAQELVENPTVERLDLLTQQEKLEDAAYHAKMKNNFGESFQETVVMKVDPQNYNKASFPSDEDRFPSHSGSPFYIYAQQNGAYQLVLTITQKACFPPGNENDRHKILTFTAGGKLDLTMPSNFEISPESNVVSLQDK